MSRDMPKEEEELKISVNPGYVLGQLLRAISAATEHLDPGVRQRAIERTKRWEEVLRSMFSGSASFGTRAPLKDIPEWVTLEVLQGGFASGDLLAGGPLQAHEIDLLERLNRRPDETARAALNMYHLSEAGRRDLCAMLESGCYRINLPEEGALLVIAWLLSHGMAEPAQEILDEITPLFDRLRFYPVPDTGPMVPSPTVHRHSVAQTATALRERRPQPHVERMMEALRVWQPLYDRTISLFLETVEDDYPCRKYPNGWRTRGQALLTEYASLRKVHTLCGKPDRPKENFCRLRGYLKECVNNPARLSLRDIGMVRHILRCYTACHGLPGSPEFAARRTAQAGFAGLPTHTELARVLLDRLRQFPESGGIENIDSIISPVAQEESVQFKIPVGSNIPANLAAKVRRCWNAPVERLVDTGVIPSGDVLAQVLPQITSQVRAAAIGDRNLRRLYGAIYSAFRRRRSLLLLNLERQVRFEDLPWIKVLSLLRQDDLNAKDEAHQVFTDLATVAILSFPHAILPNKLLQEFRTLASAAGLTVPIVEELAADIFMGTFTDKFLSAAQIGARMLRGSLYERYYGLPYERILLLDDLQQVYRAKTSPGFALLCEELAQVKKDEVWSVSRNGRIVEQSQILTTQNLAALFEALQLSPALSGRLRELAEQCFRWICKRQISSSWKANLRMVKNSAYAWRQMVFFLSFLGAETVSSFVSWARSEAGKQTSLFAGRLNPALSGLEWVANGNEFDQRGIGGASGSARRFVGWVTGHHWLLESGKKETSDDARDRARG
jgi:hypothetical protein